MEELMEIEGTQSVTPSERGLITRILLLLGAGFGKGAATEMEYPP